MTKKFEEVRRGALADLAGQYADETPKGEIVVVVGPSPERPMDGDMLTTLLTTALAEQSSLKDAVAAVVATTGLPRKQVYQAALEIEGEK